MSEVEEIKKFESPVKLNNFAKDISELIDKLEAIQAKVGPLEFTDKEPGLKGALLKLFEACCPLSRSKTDDQLWEEHLKIRELLKNEYIPTGSNVKDYLGQQDRRQNIEKMVDWAKENGADVSKLRIDDSALKCDSHPLFCTYAAETIAQGEAFLTVPSNIMIMSDIFTENDVISALVSNDPVLSSMPNIMLSYGLLLEFYLGEKSKFWPYILSLPPAYNNACYYSLEEMELLRNSISFRDALSSWKSILRQYTYFHLRILEHQHSEDSGVKNFLSNYNLCNRFCYEDFKWAAATVMSRSINIRKSSTNAFSLALVPILDFCEHGDTISSLDYEIPEKVLKASSSFEITKNEPVNLFFGARTNSQFVVNFGFYFHKNTHDFVILRVPLPNDSLLYADKQKILLQMGLSEFNGIPIYPFMEKAWFGDVVAYMRVYSANKEDLNIMMQIPLQELKSKMTDADSHITDENELASLKNFTNILQDYIKKYKESEILKDEEGKTLVKTTKCENIKKLMTFELSILSNLYEKLSFTD